MKQSIKFVSLLMISVLLLGWAHSWEAIKKTATTIKTVKAEFVQEKHMKILAKPLISNGIFYYKTANNLRWEYVRPVKSILLMYGSTISRYVKGENGYIRDSSAQIQTMQVVLREITAWFAGDFNSNPDLKATLLPGNRIVLTPKNPAMQKIIQKIELNLSKRPGAIESVVIYENPHTYTRLRFNKVTLNSDISDATFRNI